MDNMEKQENKDNVIQENKNKNYGNMSLPTDNPKPIRYRKKKFKRAEEVIHYVIRKYYKKYSKEDLPKYIIKEIINYKLINFKQEDKVIKSKELLGNQRIAGSMLWFNGIINTEKDIKKDIKRILETEELSNEKRRELEKNYLQIDEIIEGAKKGYNQVKRVYEVTKREEKENEN